MLRPDTLFVQSVVTYTNLYSNVHAILEAQVFLLGIFRLSRIWIDL